MAKKDKCMAQYQERNYAPKERKLEKSDLKQYKDRDGPRQAPEAGGGYCSIEGKPPEEEMKLIYRPPTEEQIASVDPLLLKEAWIVGEPVSPALEDILKPKKPKYKRLRRK